MAGLFQARIGEELTEVSFVVCQTLTGVSLDPIDTCGAIFTCVIDAIIDVDFTVVAVKPEGTITTVAVDAIATYSVV